MKRFHALAAALSFLLSAHALSAQAPANPGTQPTASGSEMHHHDKAPAVPSTTLRVDTGSGPATTFSMDDLKALPQITVIVHNAHLNKEEMYTGPLLGDVLAKAGLPFSEKTEHPMLHMAILAGGTDKYFVVYSAAEVQPGLHTAKVIVALQRNGAPLDTSGQFQLVDSVDVKPARWVRNLNSITVKTVQP